MWVVSIAKIEAASVPRCLASAQPPSLSLAPFGTIVLQPPPQVTRSGPPSAFGYWIMSQSLTWSGFMYLLYAATCQSPWLVIATVPVMNSFCSLAPNEAVTASKLLMSYFLAYETIHSSALITFGSLSVIMSVFGSYISPPKIQAHV